MSTPRRIPGFPGYYATRRGEIMSKWYRKRLGYGKGTKFVLGNEFLTLKPCDNNGRLCVTLYRDGKKFTKRVHRLVLLVFQGPCPKGLVGCHNDGNYLNNNNRNLRWDTQQSNCHDKKRHGTNVAAKGEKHGNSKLTENNVREIKQALKQGVPRKTLAEKYKVGLHCIRKIDVGLTWTHIKI